MMVPDLYSVGGPRERFLHLVAQQLVLRLTHEHLVRPDLELVGIHTDLLEQASQFVFGHLFVVLVAQ